MFWVRWTRASYALRMLFDLKIYIFEKLQPIYEAAIQSGLKFGNFFGKCLRKNIFSIQKWYFEGKSKRSNSTILKINILWITFKLCVFKKLWKSIFESCKFWFFSLNYLYALKIQNVCFLKNISRKLVSEFRTTLDRKW